MLPRKVHTLRLPPSTLSSLRSAGFDTLDDFEGLNADQLSEETNLPSFLCEQILKEVKASAVAPPGATQSVSSLALLEATKTIFPICPPADLLLRDEKLSGISATQSYEGFLTTTPPAGLKRGCILELSGPPGSPKERVMLEILRNVVNAGERVLFLDALNMTTSSILSEALKDVPQASSMVKYFKCNSLVHLMIFLRTLDNTIASEKAGLLVLNTISILFQAEHLSASSRSALLEEVRDILARVCASSHLTAIVLSQLSTKLVDSHGLPADFETATSAVLGPQLGDGYLPRSRTFRMILIPDSPTTGHIRLLATPSVSAENLKATILEERYEVSPIDGRVRSPGGQ